MGKIIEVLPASFCGFIVDELYGLGAEAARHRYGCRTMCRLQEHCTMLRSVATLIEMTLKDARDLCSHEFGHHVIEAILAHGLPAHKHLIAAATQSKILARN